MAELGVPDVGGPRVLLCDDAVAFSLLFQRWMRDCGVDDAVGLAERLRAAVPGDATCSIGVAEWDGHEDADALLARADAALYAAKRTGRDRVTPARAGRDATRATDPGG